MPSSTGPSLPPPHDRALDVRGSVPPGLSGRMLGIGRDGVVHSVALSPTAGASYRTRQLAGDVTIRNVISFGGTILVFGDDAPAHELRDDLDAPHAVDLAGQGQVLAPFPQHDPVTGDLHLVGRAADGSQSHVIVTAGAFTRRGRPIVDAPSRITDLVLTPDRVVFVADGFVGIAQREGEARTTWNATGAGAPRLVQAEQAGDDVVLIALTPLLERWTLRADARVLACEVLDPTPQDFVHHRDGVVWTTNTGVIRRHDLAAANHVDHHLGPTAAADVVVVADGGGAWLVGFIRDAAGTAELHVIDATDIARPALAAIPLPYPVPHGLRCTWTPGTHH